MVCPVCYRFESDCDCSDRTNERKLEVSRFLEWAADSNKALCELRGPTFVLVNDFPSLVGQYLRETRESDGKIQAAKRDPLVRERDEWKSRAEKAERTLIDLRMAASVFSDSLRGILISQVIEDAIEGKPADWTPVVEYVRRQTASSKERRERALFIFAEEKGIPAVKILDLIREAPGTYPNPDCLEPNEVERFDQLPDRRKEHFRECSLCRGLVGLARPV
jgi:hypothetical protein